MPAQTSQSQGSDKNGSYSVANSGPSIDDLVDKHWESWTTLTHSLRELKAAEGNASMPKPDYKTVCTKAFQWWDLSKEIYQFERGTISGSDGSVNHDEAKKACGQMQSTVFRGMARRHKCGRQRPRFDDEKITAATAFQALVDTICTSADHWDQTARWALTESKQGSRKIVTQRRKVMKELKSEDFHNCFVALPEPETTCLEDF